ncbi:MAG TPA: hypothetical protein VEZ46_12675, partial [Mycobacteriales bacterium]|nr:hypothetical protein [Mycobacteriales bacterium]
DRMAAGVSAFRIEGPKNNLPFFAELLADTEFAAGDYDTGLVGRMRAREAHPSQSGTTQRSPRR